MLRKRHLLGANREILMRIRMIALGLLLAAPALFAQNPTSTSTLPNLTAQTPSAPAGKAPATAAPAATHRRHHKTKKAPTPVVLPPMPSGPLRQLPMDQIPATPAKVSFEGGLLTIAAQNSTLNEILRDVRRLTGASIDVPPGSGGNERVVTHLGPGAPRDVLAGLLNGTSFNYVMMGSSSDPAAVVSVILTAKPSAAGEAQGQNAGNVYQNNPVVAGMPPGRFGQAQPFGQVVQPQPAGDQAAADADDSKDDDNADDNADDQAQPQAAPTPGNTLNPADQQAQDPNQPNAGPKTPEQILEMLRRPQQPGGAVIPPQQPPPQEQQ
jgi:hypothetical protein